MARHKSKRRPDPVREPPREKAPDDSAGLQARRLLSAVVCALLVARPLFPSEGASYEGDGQIVVMLWLLVGVGWALSLLGRRPVVVRFGWTDAAVVALVAAHTIAAVWGLTQTAPRPAMNMLWEWVAMGLGFLLVRQLLTEPRQIRAIVAMMIGLAVITAGCGLYQYFVEMPATRAAFDRDPEGMLQAAGLSIERGSAEWDLFQDRVESVEPMSTFALANSLAGFLAPWLVVAVGIGAIALTGRSVSWRTFAAVICSAGAIAVCLLLTKSRSGVLAVLTGIGLWAVLTWAPGAKRRDAPEPPDSEPGQFSRQGPGGLLSWAAGHRKPAIVGGLIAVLLVATIVGLTAIGGLDREVLSEASKSLGYRVQYWQSTGRMIAEYPWLGCGPGAFQQTYTQFKLPEASEEIRDPHNFLLEIWATVGFLAMAAMLGVLGTFAWAVWPRRTSKAPDGSTQPDHDPHAPRFLLLGGGMGLVFAFPLGLLSGVPPSVGVYLVGLPMAAIAIGLLWPWVVDGRLPRGVLAAAVGALAVNLLFAGGIGYPGVAGTFWLLIALELNRTDQGRSWTVSRRMAWATAAAAVVLLGACYVTSYRPVMVCRVELQLAEDRISLENALEHALNAAKSDPLSAKPWRQAAGLSLETWRRDFQSEALEDFQAYQLEALRLEPRSALSWHVFGDQLMEAYKSTAQLDFRDKGIDAHATAVELYPTNAVYRAHLALALLEAGQREQAEIQGREAWRLDDLTPHKDKKLPADLREWLLRSSIGK